MKNPHSELVHAVLLAVGALPYVRVWKRVVGLFYRVRFDGSGRVVEATAVYVGVKGEPDIDGIMKPGIRLGIECKTGQGVQSKEQKSYEKMIKTFGGIYILARSAEQVLGEIKKLSRVNN